MHTERVTAMSNLFNYYIDVLDLESAGDIQVYDLPNGEQVVIDPASDTVVGYHPLPTVDLFNHYADLLHREAAGEVRLEELPNGQRVIVDPENDVIIDYVPSWMTLS